MRNVKYIKGTLIPYDSNASTQATAQNVKNAVDATDFFEARRATQKWKQGIITLNYVNKVCGGMESVMDFIQALDSFTKLAGVVELRLEGTVTLIMDGDNTPVMFRVNVREGAVTYQQASYGWSDEIILPC